MHKKARHRIFIGIALLALLAFIWPIYPLAARIRPLVFSLPFGFAWLVLWILIVFAALLWLYRGDTHD